MMMTVIVTGATGFLGAAAVRELLKEGHRVIAVSRPKSAHAGRLPEDERLSVVELDAAGIRQLPQLLPQLLPHRGIAAMDDVAGMDGIVDIDKVADTPLVWLHLAWGGTRVEDRSAPEAQRDNIRLALEALETADALGCRRFLFAGSQAEYGCHDQPITEDTPCRPVTEYGKAKLEFANAAKNLCKSKKIEYIHTRIFSVYGPEDHPWSLIPSCIRTWNADGCMELGACVQKWNYLYVTDAAKALSMLLAQGSAGVYNLAGRDTRILREYIEELYRLCGARGSYHFGEQQMRAGGPVSLDPVIDKLVQRTGWHPEVDFAEGIRRILEAEG